METLNGGCNIVKSYHVKNVTFFFLGITNYAFLPGGNCIFYFDSLLFLFWDPFFKYSHMLCDVTQCYLNSIFEILEHFVILENLQIKCEEKKRKI